MMIKRFHSKQEVWDWDKKIHRRAAEGQIERAKEKQGDDYRDYLVLLPVIERINLNLWMFDQVPFSDKTRDRAHHYLSTLRGYFSIIPDEVTENLRKPLTSDSDEDIKANLLEHLGYVIGWSKSCCEEDAPQNPQDSNKKNIPDSNSLIVFGMSAWCITLAFSDFNPPFYRFDTRWPFQLSQWAICAGSVVFALRAGRTTWRGISAFILAAIFNPIAPIGFDEEWRIVEWVAATVLAALAPFWATIQRSKVKESVLAALGWSWIAAISIFGIILFAWTAFSVLTGNADERDAEKAEKQNRKYNFMDADSLRWAEAFERNQQEAREREIRKSRLDAAAKPIRLEITTPRPNETLR